MGAQFQVDVNVTTHGAEKVNELEKKLNALQTKGVDIKVNIDGLDKLDTSKLGRQFTAAGKQASQNFNRAFTTTSTKNKTKVNNLVDFAKMKQQTNQQIKCLSQIIQNGLGIDKKEADKIAKQYANTIGKSTTSAQKQQRKTQQQYQRQLQQDAKQNLAQQLSNVEKLNKNKASIITARANGKSETVEALRAERKAIKAEQKQLQKEAQQINKASGYSIKGFSNQERSKAITDRQLATRNLVDKAWASVNDKNSASLARRVEQIQKRANSGEFETRNAKADNFLSKYTGQDSETLTKARKYASELKSLQSELQSGVYSSGDKKGMKLVDSDQVKLMDQINEKAKQLQNSFTEISNLESKTLGQGVAERSANNVASYMENNTRALKKYGSALSELQQQYRSATTEMEKSSLDKSFATLKSRISAEGLTGNSWWSELKRASSQIFQFAGIYGALQNTIFQLPYKMVSAVKDYDSAMTNMQMATGISNDQAKELMNTYSDMGKQLKVTGVDVATSATEWMKQGKTIEESNKLAQDSIVLSRIGDLSSDDATRTITAAMKSYDLNESQVMDFVDQISAIDMASATDVGGLADAFNEVAANANQAGISTKQLLSYAAVIGETTQEGMSSVGTSLNAIFSRMGNIKLSRLKDYQNGGEDLSNVETVLRGVGISLRDADGEFRNFGDVLDETAGRWSEFGSVQQRAVSQAFAG